ncbi:hypothetical protein THAR02_04448 [Trichoderma harzianum]|uniref:Uncharacterized protein n=1 Tax=Trichoderma harzianum TaxID=5544 RepID=A0A0G0AEM2_TRIHA|nr:hypothetical protein THAR02_04448 [Trichoderma harzianum]
MNNTTTWEEEYYDGSLLYADHRTVLVHKLAKPTLADSFNLSTEAWHAKWKEYLDPKKSYILFKTGDLNKLGFSCSDPNDDLFLPLQFLVDLSNKQYDWNTGYKAKDSNNNDLYGIVGRNQQGNLMDASSTQVLDSVSNSQKLNEVIDKQMCHWHTINIANAFRSVDPNSGLTLLIRPVGAQNGITDGQVLNAFRRVTSHMKFHTTYILEPEAGRTLNDYTLIQVDRPFPQGSVSVGTTLTEWANVVYTAAQNNPSDPVKQVGLDFGKFLEGVKQCAQLPTAIDADKIKEAVGKRKEVKTQQSAMGGLSATHLTTLFGWNEDPPQGLTKAEPSLVASSDCFFFRWNRSGYESSWQVLYKYEAELRKLSHKAGPQGQVQVKINDGLPVRPLRNPNPFQWTFGSNPDGLHETLVNRFPWLCYALEYHITMDGSLVFGTPNTLKQVVDFFPFTRPFFTTAEALVDRFLLDELYYKRTTAIKEEIANANANNAGVNRTTGLATAFEVQDLAHQSFGSVGTLRIGAYSYTVDIN